MDCSAKNHTIKVNVFDRADYLHKGKTRKKLQLIEKTVAPKSLVKLLRENRKDLRVIVLSVTQIAHMIKQLQECQIKLFSKFRTFLRIIVAYFLKK